MKRRLLGIVGLVVVVLIVLAGIVYIAFQVSPWPSVLLIRGTGADGLDAARKLEVYVPEGIASVLNEPYIENNPDTRLDVFYPADVTEHLPTIVWVHGGAFIAGTKDALPEYLSILASHGYTVVNIEYTKAPEQIYPTPLVQLNQALEYLTANADRLHVDPQQFVLAGDSAGAHIAAQTALAISNPEYAQAAELPTAVEAGSLRGTILASGPYDISLVDLDNPQFSQFLTTVLWAYTGDRNFLNNERVAYLSIPNYVTSDYPPTFITTGPYDPLLSHSVALAEALEAQGVEVDTLFFPAESTDPSIGHEYQLDLDTPEAREAMKHMIALMRNHTITPASREGVSDGW